MCFLQSSARPIRNGSVRGRPWSQNCPVRKQMQPLDDPQISAQEAGLRYVTDLIPGIRRQKHGSGFSYISPEGKALRDPKHLERIRNLAIPPALTKVWIC